MKIISQILLLSLILVISCDKDSVSSDEKEESFSIVGGTWDNLYWTNDGGNSWDVQEFNQYKYSFKSDGTYETFLNPGGEINTLYYDLCENTIHYGKTYQFSSNCLCNDIGVNNYISNSFEIIDNNTMIWFGCNNDSNYGIKLTR